MELDAAVHASVDDQARGRRIQSAFNETARLRLAKGLETGLVRRTTVKCHPFV